MKGILVSAIILYQKCFSPDHSFWGRLHFPHGFCRFHPSCSEYAKQAVLKYGIVRAFNKIIWRLLRCNPYSAGGFDPI